MLILRISKANLRTCFSDLDVKMKRERKKEKGKNEEIHGSVLMKRLHHKKLMTDKLLQFEFSRSKLDLERNVERVFVGCQLFLGFLRLKAK